MQVEYDRTVETSERVPGNRFTAYQVGRQIDGEHLV